MRIAVDVGYSSVKGISEHGRVMFPSVTSPATEDLLAGAIQCGALQHSVRIHRTMNNVEEHLVGDAALMSTSATGFLAQREKPNGVHDLLLLTAAYLLASGHEDCLDVAIGLPISYYKAQRDELKARLEKLSTWVSVDGGAERCLHFDRIAVIPQGAGALMTAGQLPASGLVALLDIGSYTTDYLVFDIRQGQPVPVSECCGSVEAGVSLVTMALAAEFQRQAGAPLPARMHEATLAKVLAGEPLVYQGRPVELHKALTAAREQVGNLIASSVAASLRARVGFVQQMLLAGGGALLFETEIDKALSCVRVIDDPVFANAKGFLSMSADNS